MILKLYYVRNMIHNNNTYIFYQISISSNLQPNGTRRLLQANHKQSNIRNERSEQQFTAGRGIWTNQCWYGKSTSNEEASHMACLGSAQWQVISCRNEMRLYRGECCSLQKIKKAIHVYQNSREPESNRWPMDISTIFLQSTALPTELSRVHTYCCCCYTTQHCWSRSLYVNRALCLPVLRLELRYPAWKASMLTTYIIRE